MYMYMERACTCCLRHAVVAVYIASGQWSASFFSHFYDGFYPTDGSVAANEGVWSGGLSFKEPALNNRKTDI